MNKKPVVDDIPSRFRERFYKCCYTPLCCCPLLNSETAPNERSKALYSWHMWFFFPLVQLSICFVWAHNLSMAYVPALSLEEKVNHIILSWIANECVYILIFICHTYFAGAMLGYLWEQPTAARRNVATATRWNYFYHLMSFALVRCWSLLKLNILTFIFQRTYNLRSWFCFLLACIYILGCTVWCVLTCVYFDKIFKHVLISNSIVTNV
jgi:hypothetical protein